MNEKICVPKGKTLEDIILIESAPFGDDEPADEEDEIEVEYE